MAEAFEARQTERLEQEAFGALQTELPDHFAAVRKHPRLLVGTEVPALSGNGKERIRDSADAADWQEAMKAQLLAEVGSRVEKNKDELRDVFATVHSSIDLFQKNLDLIPGTKQFDKDLAEAVVVAAKDYELRAGGKLIGWSVPVQPIVNALRGQQAAARATAAAAATAAPPVAAAPTPQQQRAAEQPRTPAGTFDGPQAGIQSSAGSSAAGGNDDAAGVLAAFLRQNGQVAL